MTYKDSDYKKNYYRQCKDVILSKSKTYRDTYQYRYQQVKYKAIKVRELVFTLTLGEFGAIVSQPCFYCGKIQLPLNGVDRKDSSKGYEKDNCVPCCTMCNFMKRDYTEEEFKEHISEIHKWRQEQDV